MAAVSQLALLLRQFAGSARICGVVLWWGGCKQQGTGIREVEFID